MKLMTPDLEKRFSEVGCQCEEKDPVIIVRYFNPCGAGTWYATEYDPERREFYGYVSIFGDMNDEWGYFSLAELETYKGPLGIGLERDLYFSETRASKIIKE